MKHRRGRALKRRYGEAAVQTLRAVSKKTGRVVKPGATLTDFRGDKWRLVYPTRANETGHDGKVLVKHGAWEQQFYAGVFDLKVVG